MIHYTLLPTSESRKLRVEYRTRLIILVFLVISAVFAIGMITLLPSYFYTTSIERDAHMRWNLISETRKESGADQIEKELLQAQVIAEKIVSISTTFSPRTIIETILSHRTKDVTFTSFEITQSLGTTTIAKVIIQGKAQTREALLGFEEKVEHDPQFKNIELPLSDLAKNKNIPFSMRMDVIK